MNMEIKVLGPGCANCNKLETMTTEVVKELGIDATVEKITDIKEIAMSGVLLTPGLIIDGEIILSGKLPSKSQLAELVAKAANR